MINSREQLFNSIQKHIDDLFISKPVMREVLALNSNDMLDEDTNVDELPNDELEELFYADLYQSLSEVIIPDKMGE